MSDIQENRTAMGRTSITMGYSELSVTNELPLA
jgi:hypothetical protein